MDAPPPWPEWAGAPTDDAALATATALAPLPPRFVRHPRDGSVLRDHRGAPLSVDRLLASAPLQSELATRPGPGNKRLVYLKGDAVARLLNQVFGYDGWTLTILKSERLSAPGADAAAAAAAAAAASSVRHHVAYTSHVRITIVGGASSDAPPVYREDVGFGDATDRSFPQAAAHALKSSITDGLKRAARHFGDRLGNSLYDAAQFSFQTAPKTQAESLEDWEKRWNQKYGDYQYSRHGGSDDKENAGPMLDGRPASLSSIAPVAVRAMSTPLNGPPADGAMASAATPSSVVAQPPLSTGVASWTVHTAPAPMPDPAAAAVPIPPAAPTAAPATVRGTAGPGPPSARPTTAHGGTGASASSWSAAAAVAASVTPAPALTNSYAALVGGKRPAAWSAHPAQGTAAAGGRGGGSHHPHKKPHTAAAGAAPTTTTTTNPYGSR